MPASGTRRVHRPEGEGPIRTFVLLRQRGHRAERVLVRFRDFPRVGTGFRIDDREWVVREVDGALGFVAEPRH